MIEDRIDDACCMILPPVQELTHKASVWIAGFTDRFDHLVDLLKASLFLPHEIEDEERGRSRDTLLTMNKDLCIWILVCLFHPLEDVIKETCNILHLSVTQKEGLVLKHFGMIVWTDRSGAVENMCDIRTSQCRNITRNRFRSEKEIVFDHTTDTIKLRQGQSSCRKGLNVAARRSSWASRCFRF